MAEAIGRLVLAGREMTRLAGFTARVTEIRQVLDDLNKGKYTRTMIADAQNLSIGEAGSGKIIHKDNVICFDHVPLVTPNGDVLINDLTFEVKSGMNVLVCGPNGCGKSSLFRVLGEVSIFLIIILHLLSLIYILINDVSVMACMGRNGYQATEY